MNCRLHFTEGSAASRCQTLTIHLETYAVCEQSKELISDKKKIKVFFMGPKRQYREYIFGKYHRV